MIVGENVHISELGQTLPQVHRLPGSRQSSYCPTNPFDPSCPSATYDVFEQEGERSVFGLGQEWPKEWPKCPHAIIGTVLLGGISYLLFRGATAEPLQGIKVAGYVAGGLTTLGALGCLVSAAK